MPTREQVRQLIDTGIGYESAGRRLALHPGLVYLIATGVPADGGDTLTAEERARPGMLASSQQLINTPPENPTTNDEVERWMRERVAADPQLREAALQRDAEPGEINDPENVREVTTVLTRDHNQVKALLEQMKAIPAHSKGGSAQDAHQRKSIVDMITVALSQHEAAEQEYLWPAVRDVLDDGQQLSDQALEQEQQGKDILVALGKADPQTQEFDDGTEELDERLRAHVAFEDRVFLRLTEAMADKERVKLGKKLNRAEKAAPTRPHPHAPKEPAAAVKAAGAVAAPIDKVRDAVTHRPADDKGRKPNRKSDRKPDPKPDRKPDRKQSQPGSDKGSAQ